MIGDLQLLGVKSEPAVLDYIATASEWIDENLGCFIPVLAARNFVGKGIVDLIVDPVLSVTGVKENAVAVASGLYWLMPLGGFWENGPCNNLMVAPEVGKSCWTRDYLIEVTGLWGKYNHSVLTGTDLDGALTATDGAIKVDDGSAISPAMNLLIGTEQLLVTASGAFTDSLTDLNGAIDASVESITVDDGMKIHVGEIFKIGFEQFKALDIVTNSILVARGWNNTARATHADEDNLYALRTFAVERGVNGTTAAIQADEAPISKYLAPQPINWLCRQMAALMVKKAESGFSGRIGNDSTGETFYISEFPKTTIEEIAASFRVPV